MLWYVIILLIVIFFITGIKPWTKKNNKLVIIDEIKKALVTNDFTKVEKVTYGIYIFFYLVAIVYLSSVLTGPNIDPEDKMSYEILKDQVDYNVIIGYKDGMAITLTGIESMDGGKKSLKFKNNEYMLQDIEDKVIVYKTFDAVNPYSGSKNNKDSNESSDEIGN